MFCTGHQLHEWRKSKNCHSPKDEPLKGYNFARLHANSRTARDFFFFSGARAIFCFTADFPGKARRSRGCSCCGERSHLRKFNGVDCFDAFFAPLFRSFSGWQRHSGRRLRRRRSLRRRPRPRRLRRRERERETVCECLPKKSSAIKLSALSRQPQEE